MKKLTDEELQKLLDSKTHTRASLNTHEDAKLYEFIFDELAKEPDFTLSADFSYKVAEKLEQHRSYSYINSHSMLFISILAALLISTGTLLYINAAMLVDALAILIQFKWVILFTLTILILIEIGDKFLVRRRIS